MGRLPTVSYTTTITPWPALKKGPVSGLSCPLAFSNDEQAVFGSHERPPTPRGRHRPQPALVHLRRYHSRMSSRTFHDRYRLYQHWDLKSRCPKPPQIRLLKRRFYPSPICRRVSGFVRPPGATPTTHLPDRKQRLLPYETDNTRSVSNLQVRFSTLFLFTHLTTITTPVGRPAVESRKIVD